MAESTDEEHLSVPINSQSESPANEIIHTEETESINPIQESGDMEVHHHAHHEAKKNWKPYIWEFMMLFLAVFCGFLAEWQLEHTIEHAREKEYIISMIKELESDNEKISGVFNDTLKNNKLDSLVIALANTDNNPDNIKKAYVLKNNLGLLSGLAFNRSTQSRQRLGKL